MIGGLMFGWNALALMLTDQGIYSAGCTDEIAGRLACVIAGCVHRARQLHLCFMLNGHGKLVWAYFREMRRITSHTQCGSQSTNSES